MSAPPEFRTALRETVQREAAPPHKFGHQLRLYRLCREIGGSLPCDDDVVFAAVWLHDLGVFAGNRPGAGAALECWDHVRYAVDRTRSILPATDFPPEKIEHVLKVIREHQPQDTPTSNEAIVVRDADILEQLGAIAVLRTASKLGSDTRFHRFVDVTDRLRHQRESLPPLLRLPRARELAVSRVAAIDSFLASVAEEAEADLG